MNLTIKDLAGDIAAGGTRFELARNRVQNFSQKMLIKSKGKIRLNTSPLIYGPEDAAVAIILNALATLGIENRDLLSEASIRCYSAIDACLAGVARGERWQLIVHTGHWPVCGYRHEATLLRDGDAAWPLPDACIPCGTIMVDVAPLLQPVIRRLAEAK